jgi:hypothetical protein
MHGIVCMVQVKNDHLSLPPTSASSYVRVQASTRARGPTAHMACCLLVPLPSNHPTRMHQPTDGEMDGAVSPIHPCCSHACPVPLSSISHLHSETKPNTTPCVPKGGLALDKIPLSPSSRLRRSPAPSRVHPRAALTAGRRR